MKQIPGFPLFYAGNDGRIYKQKGKYRKQLTQFIAPYGKHIFVYLSSGNSEKKLIAVHKLVASAYSGKAHNEIKVEHIDGNIFNNKPENLKIEKVGKKTQIYEEEKVNAIQVYENLLKVKIKYNYENELWQRYRVIRESGNQKKIYNWLYVNLR